MRAKSNLTPVQHFFILFHRGVGETKTFFIKVLEETSTEKCGIHIPNLAAGTHACCSTLKKKKCPRWYSCAKGCDAKRLFSKYELADPCNYVGPAEKNQHYNRTTARCSTRRVSAANHDRLLDSGNQVCTRRSVARQPRW